MSNQTIQAIVLRSSLEHGGRSYGRGERICMDVADVALAKSLEAYGIISISSFPKVKLEAVKVVKQDSTPDDKQPAKAADKPDDKKDD